MRKENSKVDNEANMHIDMSIIKEIECLSISKA